MVVRSKEDIIQLLQNDYPSLVELGVDRCGLFGSFVKETAKENSDIDLVVSFFPGKKTFDNFMNLAFFLEDI